MGPRQPGVIGGFVWPGNGAGAYPHGGLYITALVFRSAYTSLSGGTEMIAGSSTFRPHLGRVIRDLLRLLLCCMHGIAALVYSNYPREAAVSSSLAIVFGRIASGIAWFLRSTAVSMQLPHRCRNCQRRYSWIAEPLLYQTNESLDIWACLGVNLLDIPRTPYRASVQRKTL